jgi:hypothetical protein
MELGLGSFLAMTSCGRIPGGEAKGCAGQAVRSDALLPCLAERVPNHMDTHGANPMITTPASLDTWPLPGTSSI